MKFAVSIAVLFATCVQTTFACNGFIIHTPNGDQPLVANMTICPGDFAELNIESVCPEASGRVITKLYDKTAGVAIRRGNDKDGSDGWYWNLPPLPFYSNAADELTVGKEYCFYSYLDGATRPAQITCFNVGCPCRTCDDGNACNGVETCDIYGVCHPGTPVSCAVGYSCDPLNGQCKLNEVLRPCIAVIDESDTNSDATMEAKWNAFRAAYPNRYFCLLQPQIPNTGYNRIYHPSTFDSDPRVTFKVVNRDNGNPTLASDWFQECGFNTLATTGIDFVALFIDTSGSMVAGTVSASFAKFQNDMAAANLDYCFVYNGSEDWITPFQTTLSTIGGGGNCVV